MSAHQKMASKQQKIPLGGICIAVSIQKALRHYENQVSKGVRVKSLDNGNITCIIRVLARRASHSIGNDGLDKAQAEMSATYPALLLFVQRNYNQRSERYCVYPAKYLNAIIGRRMRYGFSHK